jgi:GNAT superfamily N-acetyltransferase
MAKRMISSINVPEIVMTEVPEPRVRTWILEGLATSNRRHVHEPGLRHLSVLVKDTDKSQLLGGLWGRTAWDWLLIELLYVAPACRGAGWARRLVRAAEEEAVRRRCRSAWVYSYKFQAAGVFQHLGYSVFGTLPDYPAGHHRIFLQRSLVDVA